MKTAKRRSKYETFRQQRQCKFKDYLGRITKDTYNLKQNSIQYVHYLVLTK